MLVGFIIVTVLSVALHVFMMLISTLGCFVHTARLQYVEFFGKFYEAWGGVHAAEVRDKVRQRQIKREAAYNKKRITINIFSEVKHNESF